MMMLQYQFSVRRLFPQISVSINLSRLLEGAPCFYGEAFSSSNIDSGNR